MDVALGVAVTDRVARLALVDSAAPGTVIDQFVLDVAEHPVEVLTETVVGTDRSLAGENHRLVATRLCWPDQAKADELQHALQDSGVHDVAVISEAQAATALVGAAHAGSAVLLVGDETATLSVVGDPDAPPTMVAVAPVAGADATSTVDTLMARLGDQALAPGDVFLVGRSAEHTTVLADQLRAASTMRVHRRLVLASSMVVYGQGRYDCPQHGPVDPLPRRRADLDNGVFEHRCPGCGEPVIWQLVDEDAPLRPRSLYAASKTAQEHYALAWSEASGGSVVALRYHNVYGPGMPRDTPYSGVAAIFRSAVEKGKPPKVFEDGGQMRDFVHVDDVAAANLAAVHLGEADRDGFTAVNVCSGRPISILQVATAICDARGGSMSPAITGHYRSGDVRHIVADPARAARVLGFRAAVDPGEGLREFAFAPLR